YSCTVHSTRRYNLYFLLLLRRAPPSTLFPYTTLFRSAASLSNWDREIVFVTRWSKTLGTNTQLRCHSADISGLCGLSRSCSLVIQCRRRDNANGSADECTQSTLQTHSAQIKRRSPDGGGRFRHRPQGARPHGSGSGAVGRDWR